MSDFQPSYEYRATLHRVVDGDTADFDVDLGMKVYTRQRFRLLGINAPEKRKPTYDAGIAARDHLTSLLLRYSIAGMSVVVVLVKTHKDKTGKYGRYLAELIGKDPETGERVNLNQKMIEDGHAVEYGK